MRHLSAVNGGIVLITNLLTLYEYQPSVVFNTLQSAVRSRYDIWRIFGSDTGGRIIRPFISHLTTPMDGSRKAIEQIIHQPEVFDISVYARRPENNSTFT